MRAVRSWVSGIVMVMGSMALPLQGRAQQEASDTTKSLEARVDELDQQVRILQRLRELAAESPRRRRRIASRRRPTARTASA